VKLLEACTTRRGFIQRSGAAITATFAYAAYHPRGAQASEYCKVVHNYPICPSGTTSQCRVRFGPPSCLRSEVTVVSPNDQWYHSCVCRCNQGCTKCDPDYFQARGAARNSGSCSCTCVYIV
jgi:hypothetical protein